MRKPTHEKDFKGDLICLIALVQIEIMALIDGGCPACGSGPEVGQIVEIDSGTAVMVGAD